jgi:hypothetical protein
MLMRESLAVIVLLVALVLSGCGPNAQQVAAEQEARRQDAAATSTAVAKPTLEAQSLATAGVSTATAVAQATQQARELNERVAAAVAATQTAVPTATPSPTATAMPSATPTATAVPPTATLVPPTETPVPPTPIVIVVTQAPLPPVYVPVPVPAQSGAAPQYVIDAINASNNAYAVAKWTLSDNDLVGHIIGQELANGREYLKGLRNSRTRVQSTFISGYVTSWTPQTPTRVIATTSETWRFVNYDSTTYMQKYDNGPRLYRNTYTIDYVSGVGWKVSLDDVPNHNGEPA